MNTIINVSAIDIQNGNHPDPGDNSMLIQISDVMGWCPTPKFHFKEVHKFEFADTDCKDPANKSAFSDTQAEEILRLLTHAKEQKMNVIVHCVAGMSRSGGVAAFGEMYGFYLLPGPRTPNICVKSKLMKAAGFLY